MWQAEQGGMVKRSETAIMAGVIELAKARCHVREVELTPLRRRALQALVRARKPLKAYDLMEAMRVPGGRDYPFSIYRALEFLQAVGLVRWVERLNVYMLWIDNELGGPVSLFIYERCSEVQTGPLDLGALRAPCGFRITRSVSEHYGGCAPCGTPMA
jgi:Fur family zinc uptake transcriptional regulator